LTKYNLVGGPILGDKVQYQYILLILTIRKTFLCLSVAQLYSVFIVLPFCGL